MIFIINQLNPLKGVLLVEYGNDLFCVLVIELNLFFSNIYRSKSFPISIKKQHASLPLFTIFLRLATNILQNKHSSFMYDAASVPESLLEWHLFLNFLQQVSFAP